MVTKCTPLVLSKALQNNTYSFHCRQIADGQKVRGQLSAIAQVRIATLEPHPEELQLS
jgi:hypothetical protein